LHVALCGGCTSHFLFLRQALKMGAGAVDLGLLLAADFVGMAVEIGSVRAVPRRQLWLRW